MNPTRDGPPLFYINPFSTAVPFWGRTTLFSSVLSPKRDCGPTMAIRVGVGEYRLGSASRLLQLWGFKQKTLATYGVGKKIRRCPPHPCLSTLTLNEIFSTHGLFENSLGNTSKYFSFIGMLSYIVTNVPCPSLIYCMKSATVVAVVYLHRVDTLLRGAIVKRTKCRY